MNQPIYKSLSFAVLFLQLIASSAIGAEKTTKESQNFTLKMGQVFFTNLQSTFTADRRVGPISTTIDFNRDLELADSLNSFLFEGYYLYGPQSRIDITYYKVDRDGQKTIDRDITIGDSTFNLNTIVKSSFKTETFIVTYSYMFHSHDEIDLGISAGLHVNKIDLLLEAPAANVYEKQKILIPLPVIGIFLNYDLTSRLSVNYQMRSFVLNYDKFRGNLIDTKLTFEHHTFENFGFEFGFNRKSTDLEIREATLFTKYTNTASGWLANFLWYF